MVDQVVDARPLAIALAAIVGIVALAAVIVDLTDAVTNTAELPIGGFAGGMALLSLSTVGASLVARRRVRDPLVGMLTGLMVALTSSVFGLIALSVTGVASLYLIGAAGSLVALSLSAAPRAQAPGRDAD